MKDLLKISFFILILGLTIIFRNDIASFVTDQIMYKGSNNVLTYNEYYLENNYLYVKNTDISKVTNYQEILDVFYTVMNSGDDCFSFYCDYNNCINDVKSIINNNSIISNINNFVHPYNSFDTINIDVNSNNKVTVTINKLYKDDEITYINNYITNFINTYVNLSMNNYDKIKVFHDHIVNTTKYDENNTLDSYTAYNLLTTKLSICGGYSDIMSIYLHKLGIKNYKINSENHIWNLVNLDGTWLHLDATWNDPIANDGNQYLIHNFFMIPTQKLLELDKVEHNFDRNVYLEAN